MAITQAKYFDRFTGIGLVLAIEIKNRILLRGGQARVGITWMDYGQSWAWETVLVHCPKLDLEFQLLSPKEFEKMNEGILTDDEMDKIVEKGLK